MFTKQGLYRVVSLRKGVEGTTYWVGESLEHVQDFYANYFEQETLISVESVKRVQVINQ